MKRSICLLITLVLIFSLSSVAFAKTDKGVMNNSYQVSLQEKINLKKVEVKAPKKEDKKKEEEKKKKEEEKKRKEEEKKRKEEEKKRKEELKKIFNSIFNRGKHKLPVDPIIKGMGAAVTYDEKNAVLTMINDKNTITIDFINEKVLLNGILIKDPAIFEQLNNAFVTVLVQYIVDMFGMDIDNPKDIVKLDSPKNVTVSIVGQASMTNTINASSLYLTASAEIKAGQATGGRAELYVGSRFVAADLNIAATDTVVTFSTTDNSPTNAELQALIPEGGEVIVKLYTADNKSVSTSKKNPTLIVDYSVPVIAGATTAIYNVKGKELYIIVNNAEKVGDKVDVTKLTLYDTALGRAYQLTAASKTGSKGVVNSSNSLTIGLGASDMAGLSGFGSSNVVLAISKGALLYDEAGNVSAGLTDVITIPVIVINN